ECIRHIRAMQRKNRASGPRDPFADRRPPRVPFRCPRQVTTIDNERQIRDLVKGRSMRVDFYGLAFETPHVTFHLWSPWRAAVLEHRLFEAVRNLPRTEAEMGPDEGRIHISDPKTWRAAVQAVARVLTGWQAEA